MATVIADRAPPRARAARSKFYVGLALLITAIVFAGFGPIFFTAVTHGDPRPWIIHVHGAVYVGWLALLVAQSVLAARGEIALHRRVGRFGVAYAVLVWVLGLVVSFALPVLHLRAGDWTMQRAAGFLPIPLGDMVLFAGFFGAAIAYRRKPEIHKRLIVLAAVAVMYAAVGRVWFVDSMPDRLLLWYSPVVVAMAYDLWSRRTIHPVYVVGVVLMGVALLRVPFGRSELWQDFARPILGALANG